MAKTQELSQLKKYIAGGDTTSLFISLYLVVLAFFIMLNTISTVSTQRVVKAIDSIGKTFTVIETRTVKHEQKYINQTEGDELLMSDYMMELKKVFQQTLQVQVITNAKFSNLMYIKVPKTAIYLPNSSALRHTVAPLMMKVAGVVSSAKGNLDIDIEYIMNSKYYLRGLENDHPKVVLDVSRAGNFAASLIQYGVESQRILVGLNASEDDLVTIKFTGKLIEDDE